MSWGGKQTARPVQPTTVDQSPEAGLNMWAGIPGLQRWGDTGLRRQTRHSPWVDLRACVRGWEIQLDANTLGTGKKNSGLMWSVPSRFIGRAITTSRRLFHTNSGKSLQSNLKRETEWMKIICSKYVKSWGTLTSSGGFQRSCEDSSFSAVGWKVNRKWVKRMPEKKEK